MNSKGMGPRTWKRESKAKSFSGLNLLLYLGLVVLCGHQVSLLGSLQKRVWSKVQEGPSVLFEAHLWQPLAWSALLSGGLGLLLLHLVGVHSVQEVLPALAMLHMLHTHADPLGQDLA